MTLRMKAVSDSKIKKLPALTKIITKIKKQGQKTVLCHGIFDLVHPGHIRYFQAAKKHGDILIVALTADKFVNQGPGRPIFRDDLRAEFLASIGIVDFVVIVHDSNAVSIINKIKPDFFVKGSDSRETTSGITGKVIDIEEKAIKKAGGKFILTQDKIVYSSSKIINDYLDIYPPKTKAYLNKLKLKYSLGSILDQLYKIKKTKILVIGDAIIDQYHYCRPIGKSSKEPVLVHQYVSDESYIGGVLATANHIAALSDHITLVSLLGKKNSYKRLIINKLKGHVDKMFFFNSGSSTIVKRRFLDIHTGQKLFQVSFMKDDFVMSSKIEQSIATYIEDNIHKFDLVVVNDFGHGLMTDKLVKLVSQRANFLALNVQTNSANFGFNIIIKYPRADFICVDDQEIRLATHDKYGNLRMLIQKVFQRMRCRAMMVTKGSLGSLTYTRDLGFVESPSLTDKIVDRVGAGDALFSIVSPCVHAQMPIELVAFIGNVAGALKVQIVGNKKQIEFEDLERFITRLLK